MTTQLATERLRIRPLQAADVPAFVAYRRIPDVARFQDWDESYDEQRANALVESQVGRFIPPSGEWVQLGIRDAITDELLGDVAIHTLGDQPDSYELGFTLAPASQGAGFATEAVIRVLEYLFRECGAHRVSATCDSRNRPSARLLERVGLRQEARHHSAEWFKDEWTSVDVFALLADEFAER